MLSVVDNVLVIRIIDGHRKYEYHQDCNENGFQLWFEL